MKDFKIKDKVIITNINNSLDGKIGIILDIDNDFLEAKVKIYFDKENNKYIIQSFPLENLELYSEDTLNEKFIKYINESYNISNKLNAGAAFINREGKFIQSRINDLHKEIAWDLLDEDPNRAELIARFETDDDDPGDRYLSDILIDQKQWIRINSGTDYEDRAYVAFEEIKHPTFSQYDAVETFLNYLYDHNINDRKVEIFCDYKNHNIYDLNDILPEDVIKKVKRYYSSGTLFEAFKNNNYIENYLYDGNNNPVWFSANQIAQVENKSLAEVINDAKEFNYKIYAILGNTINIKVILHNKCDINNLFNYYNEFTDNLKIKEI